MKRDIFNTIELPQVGSNVFDLSHEWRSIFGIGQLIPTLLLETLPGDKFHLSSEIFVKAMPLVNGLPFRSEVNMYYFFIPNRIVWSEWEDWITGESSAEWPYLDVTQLGTYQTTSLAAYFGIWHSYWNAQQNAFYHQISAIPFAAYYRVITDYFYDENLQAEGEEVFDPWDMIDLSAGENNIFTGGGNVLHINYRHDYYTACLPFAQKGDEVQLPIFESDELLVQTYTSATTPAVSASYVRKISDDTAPTAGDIKANNVLLESSASESIYIDPNDNLYVDVTTEAATISQLRAAYRLQEFLEKDARGGTRYIENILAHFGVRSSDGRLARSEYIGSVRTKLQINEVISTALSIDGSSNEYPLGESAGHANAIATSESLTYYCEEHGHILALIVVRPEPIWYQGIDKKWMRSDRLDYYWPSFANIGEQEVLNYEVFNKGHADDLETFGYIPRYAEYKYHKNMAVGSIHYTGFESWLPGREFSTQPSLNYDFIRCKADHFEDIFAYTDINDWHQIFAWVYHNIKAVRKMPFFANPTI